MSNLSSVKGIGDASVKLLAKLGINSIAELVDYVPRRYVDYSHLSDVASIRPGLVTIKVKISVAKGRYSKKGMHMTEATASDATSSVKLIWFNQPYRAHSIKAGEEYFVSGEFASNYKFFAITNPACELVSDFPVNTARLVPVYKLTKGLGMPKLRRCVKNALLDFTPKETLPEWLLDEEDLMPRGSALSEMHFPISMESLDVARRRLGFEEIFELTLASELNKQAHSKNKGLKIPFNLELTKKLVASLGFELTGDQKRVTWQILQDLGSGAPMNRLLEGDVGSGKTVVAAIAVAGVIQSGMQAAFLAPTEILATQHAESLRKLMTSVGMGDSVMLLTGSMSATQKKLAAEAIASGNAQFIIGTHAIFQDKIKFKDLGLIVVDEQHRFGVNQRKQLQAKASVMPHVLNMTATPIPRSLALTLYGEMEVSIIKEMPPGRTPIETTVDIPEIRPSIYKALAAEVDKGRQAFVVCPQIEEDEAGRLSVIKMHKELTTKWLKGCKVGLLHGKLKSDEKESIMSSFASGDLDVIVTTTVIEVGVDVPNATVMVIEGADRFGLAQLHQLRGRVGRGKHSGRCHLVMAENGEPSKRLRMLERENSGFKLAEFDLETRGPGAIYGTMQHGALDLRVAKLTDIELIQSARASAKRFIDKGESLLKYPQLNARVQQLRTITNLN